ncbi:MAG: biotin/lipoyl-containing protein, partial [Phreatobacter sp.]|uniref:biotin/lipoyl-containing protein n=1 Tax=Phreatobacter sp. TaxID=1966341 RepID=UPI0027345868
MATEIRVPTLGESVTEATVAKWFKKPGEAVKQDEPLVELETDKVTLEVNAPASGTLSEIVAESGTTVGVAALLGQIAEGAAAAAAAPAKAAEAPKAAPAPAPAPAKAASADNGPAVARIAAETARAGGNDEMRAHGALVAPANAKAASEQLVRPQVFRGVAQ